MTNELMRQIRITIQYLVWDMWGKSPSAFLTIWVIDEQKHIGAGVRYNARKQKVGNYYSTPIFGFKCKCHLCDGWFEIRTDPKVCDTILIKLYHTVVLMIRMRRMKYSRARRSRTWTGIQKRMEDSQLKVRYRLRT